MFPISMDLSEDGAGSTRFGCTRASSDAIALPASTHESKHPFDDAKPFSYLQYSLSDIAEYQFVAVIDKSAESTPGWVIAEFVSLSDSVISRDNDLTDVITNGVDVMLGPDRPMMTEITIPSIHSSLLAYKLAIIKNPSSEHSELFAPLLRQSISEPYESKFFVNFKEAEVSLHGVAPYMPPSMRSRKEIAGLYLQFWADPTCNNTMEISLKVDYLGSMGKLWMRYRTVFAAFPLLVVALVLRKQFTTHDASGALSASFICEVPLTFTGVFISFSESMDKCIRRSIPCLFLALTILAVSFSRASSASSSLTSQSARNNGTETPIVFTQNDLLLGSQDSFFLFLVPLFGIISIGICIALNFLVLVFTHFFAITLTWTRRIFANQSDAR